MAHFSDILRQWYEVNRRDLPWRETRDPYLIWVSEVILQQTQVRQGLPYYFRFVERFPEVKALAEAPEDELLKMWEGLGYYSRARNMHAAAKRVVNELGGVFPGDYETLLTLKGTGDYTAAAVASIASGEARAVTDGNVTRVLARYHGVTLPVDAREGAAEINRLASLLLDTEHPGLHNQALMEFGALCCTPRNPNCPICPLLSSCFAYHHHMTSALPLKKRKPARKLRFFHFYLIEDGLHLTIEKRSHNDIWKNLYQLPLLETDHPLSDTELLNNPLLLSLCGSRPCQITGISNTRTHELTHRRIIARFVRIQTSPLVIDGHRMIINRKEIHKFAFPALIRDYLAEAGLTSR